LLIASLGVVLGACDDKTKSPTDALAAAWERPRRLDGG
jgi:hypothetical protein